MTAWVLMEGGFETRRAPREAVLVVMTICFALSTSTALLNFLKLCIPPELILTREGFSVRGLRRAQLIRWEDVSRFELVELRGVTLAGYILKPDTQSGVRDRAVTKFLLPGVDGTIAVFPEESPGFVVKILNEWRRRHTPYS